MPFLISSQVVRVNLVDAPETRRIDPKCPLACRVYRTCVYRPSVFDNPIRSGGWDPGSLSENRLIFGSGLRRDPYL